MNQSIIAAANKIVSVTRKIWRRFDWLLQVTEIMPHVKAASDSYYTHWGWITSRPIKAEFTKLDINFLSFDWLNQSIIPIQYEF